MAGRMLIWPQNFPGAWYAQWELLLQRSACRLLAGHVAKGTPDRANHTVDMLSGCAGCRAGGQSQKGEQKGAGKFHKYFLGK